MPDEQLGYLAFGWVTMGQMLSLPWSIAGASVLLPLASRAGLDGDGAPSERGCADAPRARRCSKKAG